jgi:hypothetical protein
MQPRLATTTPTTPETALQVALGVAYIMGFREHLMRQVTAATYRLEEPEFPVTDQPVYRGQHKVSVDEIINMSTLRVSVSGDDAAFVGTMRQWLGRRENIGTFENAPRPVTDHPDGGFTAIINGVRPEAAFHYHRAREHQHA